MNSARQMQRISYVFLESTGMAFCFDYTSVLCFCFVQRLRCYLTNTIKLIHIVLGNVSIAQFRSPFEVLNLLSFYRMLWINVLNKGSLYAWKLGWPFSLTPISSMHAWFHIETLSVPKRGKMINFVRFFLMGFNLISLREQCNVMKNCRLVVVVLKMLS